MAVNPAMAQSFPGVRAFLAAPLLDVPEVAYLPSVIDFGGPVTPGGAGEERHL